MIVQVYTTAWCRDCRAAKQFLEEHGIVYTEINVDADPAASAEVLSAWASAPSRNWSSTASGSSRTSPAAACSSTNCARRLGIPRG